MSGDELSGLFSCLPVSCWMMCGVMSEIRCWYELYVVTLVMLLPYSHWMILVTSTGLGEEIAKFCVMDDAFVTSVPRIIAFALPRTILSLCSLHAPNMMSLLVILLLMSRQTSVSIGCPAGFVTVIGNSFA